MHPPEKLWIGRKLESSFIRLKTVGALTRSTVGTLISECREWIAAGKTISVDLSEVAAFDRAAADALIQLVDADGVDLRDPPQHVALLLKHLGLKSKT